jgi:hypothetical protein
MDEAFGDSVQPYDADDLMQSRVAGTPPAWFATDAFRRYVAPARARPQVWRLVAGMTLALVLHALWAAAMIVAVAWTLDRGAVPGLLATLGAPSQPLPTLFLLATFAGLAAGVAVAVRLLHHRKARTLIGPPGAGLRHFAITVAVVAAVYGAVAAITGPVGVVPNLPPATWAVWLMPGLIAVLIQTGAEEAVFRGYLMQQLAARFRRPFVWFVIPALLFGAAHYDPSLGLGALPVVAMAALFGLIAADLTRVTGSLSAAWGLHFANNVSAVLVLATPGTITGLARYLAPDGVGDADAMLRALPVDAGLLLAVWALSRMTLSWARA